MKTPKPEDYSEEQLREMEAGEELDVICRMWRDGKAPAEREILYCGACGAGPYYRDDDGPTLEECRACHRELSWRPHDLPHYSTQWRDAGPLLEAMQHLGNGYDVGPTYRTLSPYQGEWAVMESGGEIDGTRFVAFSDAPQLAIARAAAIDWKRGIDPREVSQ